jgi:tol-pal system protein YbgF
MTRHWNLPHARPTLLLAIVAIAASMPAAHPQDVTTQERLDRLERDLSMLQRQVYRDGVSPGDDTSGGTAGNLAVDTQIRMDRLEQQMRDLTGKVEDEANEMQRLRQRLEQINSDIDVRLGELNQGSRQARVGSPAGPPPAPPPPPPQAFAERGETADLPPAGYGNPSSPGAYVPPPDAGTLTPPGAAPPASAEPPPDDVAPGEALPPARRSLPSASASAQYNEAFGLLRQADYSAAADAFRNFVQQHPDSGLAGNAQYWLGESYYARGRYSDAAVAFAEGYKRYPKGSKASETLLKLGMALGRAHQRQNACVALGQLDHDFPHAANAVKERATEEQKRFGC